MAHVPQRDRIVRQTNCGKCGAPIRIDVTDFEPSMTISNCYSCEHGHEYVISVRGTNIISIEKAKIESDIDNFVGVPEHIRKLVKEAYGCSSNGEAVAGACVVRRLLDELLFDLGFHQKYVGKKLNKFAEKCNIDGIFKQSVRTIFDRMDIFRTIANLGGYHAHAHGKPIVDVVKSEFDTYLQVVEGAIKDKWPIGGTP